MIFIIDLHNTVKYSTAHHLADDTNLRLREKSHTKKLLNISTGTSY